MGVKLIAARFITIIFSTSEIDSFNTVRGVFENKTKFDVIGYIEESHIY